MGPQEHLSLNWNSSIKISVFKWDLNSTHLNFETSFDTKLYANEATSFPLFWLIFVLLAVKENQ